MEYIRSLLFPLGTTRRVEDVIKALDELEAAGLVIRYAYAGKPYLQVTKWQRCGKSENSRFPWKDGGHAITYVQRMTRDGDKAFIASSITPSPPHTDGVTTKTNTETETETETETGGGVGGDALDSEIRAFVSGHPLLTWDPKTHGKCRELVTAVGWERAQVFIAEALKKGSSFPIGWALGKARNAEQAKGATANAPPPKPRQSIRKTVLHGRV